MCGFSGLIFLILRIFFVVLSVLFVLVLCLLAHQPLLIACLPIVGDYLLQLNFLNHCIRSQKRQSN